MSATQSATVAMDLYNIWTDILNNYLGQEVTHIQITKTLDPNGGVIDEFQNDSTIYGAISPVSGDAIRESVGTIQIGDLVAYFLSEEDVIVGTQTGASEARYDMISYEGILYYVEKRMKIAYDGGVAVVAKYILRKVANEV